MHDSFPVHLQSIELRCACPSNESGLEGEEERPKFCNFSPKVFRCELTNEQEGDVADFLSLEVSGPRDGSWLVGWLVAGRERERGREKRQLVLVRPYRKSSYGSTLLKCLSGLVHTCSAVDGEGGKGCQSCSKVVSTMAPQFRYSRGYQMVVLAV